MSAVPLSAEEARVLGTLLEKEATTPEYYPLSLNALVTGCNQKNNREPVVSYDSGMVERALEGLRQKGFAIFVTGSGRVDKYAQRISETLNLGRRESAVLCTLLLRGPQTLGEIRGRSERMYAFEELSDAERTLEKLAEWPTGALAMKLRQQPGQKEARYAHLLSGEISQEELARVTERTASSSAAPGRMEQLENELREVRVEMESVKQRLELLEGLLR